ncbi:MAG: hypothetical protein QE484_12255 [Rhizobium sp.]|nr:hypothetical protein [Rhizobium sp.]
MKKIIAMHEAKTPSGEPVTLYEMEELADMTMALVPSANDNGGVRTMELSDGRRLKLVGHGEYLVEATGEAFLLDRR